MVVRNIIDQIKYEESFIFTDGHDVFGFMYYTDRKDG